MTFVFTHFHIVNIVKGSGNERTLREGKACVELPLEYQRVPAPEGLRPATIKHALLMMRLSLLH